MFISILFVIWCIFKIFIASQVSEHRDMSRRKVIPGK